VTFSDLTIQLMVMRLLSGLIIAMVQGFAIAGVAVMLRDPGPRYDGRLTPVPFPHVDLIGLVSLILSGFGWSRFVAVEAEKLRFGRWGLVIVVLAGSAVLLAAAALLLLLVVPSLTLLPYTAGLAAAAFFRVAARLCVWTALFALLPVPPLAGAHFLAALGIRLPASAGTVGAIVLLVASVLGVTRMVLTPVYAVVAPIVLGPEFAY